MGERGATGELAVIRRIGRLRSARAGELPAAGAGVRVGIGDDCAVLRVRADEEMVVTTDFSLEGRHFRRDWHTAESAGHRCLARGLSDLAAMGARPVAVFLSLGLPGGYDAGWLEGFLRGLDGLAVRLGVTLAGGDTAEAPGDGVVADIVAVGAVKRGRALLRSGARAGDGLYCTGRLGGAAAELAAMAAGVEWTGVQAQSFPEPRVAVGRALARGGKRWRATAAMDLSDGLSTDLGHLCAASGVGAELETVPVAEGATREQALHGGEDYELLFAARGVVPKRIAGVEVTRLGVVTEGRGVRLEGRRLRPGGWEHLKGGRG